MYIKYCFQVVQYLIFSKYSSWVLFHTFVGLRYRHRKAEHVIPQFMNKKWQQNYKSYGHTYDARQFLKLYREKLFLEKKKARK